MKKQHAIIQLKEKTTLLAQADEHIRELNGKVERIAQVEQQLVDLQRRFDGVLDALHTAQRKLQLVQEAVQ